MTTLLVEVLECLRLLKKFGEHYLQIRRSPCNTNVDIMTSEKYEKLLVACRENKTLLLNIVKDIEELEKDILSNHM